MDWKEHIKEPGRLRRWLLNIVRFWRRTLCAWKGHTAAKVVSEGRLMLFCAKCHLFQKCAGTAPTGAPR